MKRGVVNFEAIAEKHEGVFFLLNHCRLDSVVKYRHSRAS